MKSHTVLNSLCCDPVLTIIHYGVVFPINLKRQIRKGNAHIILYRYAIEHKGFVMPENHIRKKINTRKGLRDTGPFRTGPKNRFTKNRKWIKSIILLANAPEKNTSSDS